MTIIGCKKNSNAPKKPLKRYWMKRKAPMKRSKQPLASRSASPGSNEAAEAKEAFAALYRGLPCAVCGRKKWGKIPTVGHHILKAEIFPQFRLEPKNMIPLCAEHHTPFAHDHAGTFEKNEPGTFLHWLHDNEPVQWAWAKKNNHHR